MKTSKQVKIKNLFVRPSDSDALRNFVLGISGRKSLTGISIRGITVEIGMSCRVRAGRPQHFRFEIKPTEGIVENDWQWSVRAETPILLKQYKYEEDFLNACSESMEKLIQETSTVYLKKRKEAFKQNKNKFNKLANICSTISQIIDVVNADKNKRFRITPEWMEKFNQKKNLVASMEGVESFESLPEDASVPDFDYNDVRIEFFDEKNNEYAVRGSDDKLLCSDSNVLFNTVEDFQKIIEAQYVLNSFN